MHGIVVHTDFGKALHTIGDCRGWPGVARATPESSLATPVATPDLIADQPHQEEVPAVSGAPPAKHGTSSSDQSDSEGISVGDGDSDDREAPHVAQVHAAPPGPHDVLQSRAEGPTQPQLKVFPRTMQGNRKRSFNIPYSIPAGGVSSHSCHQSSTVLQSQDVCGNSLSNAMMGCHLSHSH
ncbi:hypothetical protein UPYG_G00252900 [Umbra pygmaea]|uniref:Uncharacterized protein n=1 Tax=Umbra pygmaea TaxID=75934 RepID=A0ABD0WCP4_UMBPY